MQRKKEGGEEGRKEGGGKRGGGKREEGRRKEKGRDVAYVFICYLPFLQSNEMYHYTLTHIHTHTLTVIFKVNLQNVDIDEILRPKFLNGSVSSSNL